MVASRRAKADSAIILEGISVLELLLEKDPAALDALDNYIESFTGWHAGWKSRVSEHPSDKELKAVGAEVAKQHSEVLRLAGELKESISASLRSLKRKGKGLIAYSDTLPKRISTIRPRKG
jgi:hypothetical protein